MGRAGLALLGVTVTAGIVTGLVGNFIGASRLMYAMTEDGILPEWFGWLDGRGNPKNAFLFLMALSAAVPFAGRAAIGWIVDVNTIGALIAYAYTSAAAFKTARGDGNRLVRCTGAAGAVISLLFFLYFMIPSLWTVSAMSTESYLILIVWSILGFLFFRYVFRTDTRGRFGRTTVVWIALLFLIFFTSMLWLRQTTHEATQRVLSDLTDHNVSELAEHGVVLNDEDHAESEVFLQEKMAELGRDMMRSSWVQMAVLVVALLIMLSIYKSMTQREQQLLMQKVQAEESSKAKSVFLSNMSHDLRTPMFDAYSREKTADGIQGTGLGMAITKSIVDMMGGTIDVETAPGKGTEFIIRLSLPAADGAAVRRKFLYRQIQAVPI